jgi:hypothetical protein
MQPNAFQRKPINPAESFSESQKKHSNRRSNHIVRHRPDAGPVILRSTRVAKPVTVATTPEQARQAAIIASTAFQPIYAPPKITEDPVIQAAINPSGPNAEPVDGPHTSSRATVIILVVTIVILLLALVTVGSLYLASRTH